MTVIDLYEEIKDAAKEVKARRIDEEFSKVDDKDIKRFIYSLSLEQKFHVLKTCRDYENVKTLVRHMYAGRLPFDLVPLYHVDNKVLVINYTENHCKTISYAKYKIWCDEETLKNNREEYMKKLHQENLTDTYFEQATLTIKNPSFLIAPDTEVTDESVKKAIENCIDYSFSRTGTTIWYVTPEGTVDILIVPRSVRVRRKIYNNSLRNEATYGLNLYPGYSNILYPNINDYIGKNISEFAAVISEQTRYMLTDVFSKNPWTRFCWYDDSNTPEDSYDYIEVYLRISTVKYTYDQRKKIVADNKEWLDDFAHIIADNASKKSKNISGKLLKIDNCEFSIDGSLKYTLSFKEV